MTNLHVVEELPRSQGLMQKSGLNLQSQGSPERLQPCPHCDWRTCPWLCNTTNSLEGMFLDSFYIVHLGPLLCLMASRATSRRCFFARICWVLVFQICEALAESLLLTQLSVPLAELG